MAEAKIKKPIVKKEEVKAAAPVAAKEEVKKAPAKKAPAKKAAPAKAAEVKAEVKKEVAKKAAPAKATPAKKAPAKKAPAKKVAIKSDIKIELAADRQYTNDDLVKILKDVWKYDLKKKVSDIKTVEMYVKPYEASVYYKVNGEVEGEFSI